MQETWGWESVNLEGVNGTVKMTSGLVLPVFERQGNIQFGCN